MQNHWSILSTITCLVDVKLTVFLRRKWYILGQDNYKNTMVKSQVMPANNNMDKYEMGKVVEQPETRLIAKCETVEKDLMMMLVKGIYEDFSSKVEYINKQDEHGCCALHMASRHNNVALMKKLIEAGAEVNMQDDNGYTSLHIATRFNCIEASEILLSNNADVTIPTNDGALPLHVASRLGFLDVVKLLAEKNLDTINARDAGEATPLYLASKNGNAELCEWLIENGADLTIVTSENKTPLHIAALGGHLDVLKLLIKVASKKLLKIEDYINITQYEGFTSLHLACAMGHERVAHELIINGANIHAKTLSHRYSMLHLVASSGNLTIIEDLLDHGADIEAIDGDHRTPLHKAATSNREESIKFLLDKGAKIDSVDVNKQTPFLIAVQKGKTEAATLLLERGANMNALDVELRTCFHLAINNLSLTTLKMLISNDKESLIEKTEWRIQNPLHYAAAVGNVEILNTILNEFHRLTDVDENEMTPLHIAALQGNIEATEILAKAKRESMGYRDVKGRTPLHCAAEKGFKKTCEVLLKLGASISARDNSKRSPLHSAVESNALSTVNLLLTNKDSYLLSMLDKDENSALHLACASAEVGIVKALLDNNADVTVLNKKGQTCLDVAIDWVLEDVALVLIKHPRWWEIMSTKDKDGYGPMKQLIIVLPRVAQVALDQCVSVSPLPANNKDYWIAFDLSLLDPGPDDPPALRGEPFEGCETMVEYDREDLLNHALTQALLRYKWFAYGKMINYINFALCLILTVMYTAFIMLERDKFKFYYPSTVNSTAENTRYLKDGHEDSTLTIAGVLTFIVALELLKEIYQIVMLRLDYLKELSNPMELSLFICALLFLAPYLAGKPLYSTLIQWNSGVVALFLMFVDLLLFVRRFGQGGIYVSMYFEVWYSFVKLLGVFVVVLFGSNAVLYVLLKEEDNFSTVWFSFAKTLVMMVGELDYTDVLSDNVVNKKISDATGVPFVPLPDISYVVFVLFMIAVPVLLMNLLIGVAVGDIDSIQKSASFSRVKDQVKFISDAQKRYPRKILRYLYKQKMVVKPNVNRFVNSILLSGTSVSDSEYFDSLLNMKTAVSENSADKQENPSEKQKRKLRDIEAKLDRQQVLLSAIAEKLGIVEEADSHL